MVMTKSKYVDTAAIIQVIGAVFKNPNLLDDERYFFSEEDFPERFHKILFGSIFNLHQLGAKVINIGTIEDYLIQRPNILAIYKNNKGREYLEEITNKNITGAFDFYYGRVKKMSLFRAYESIGLDLSWLYDVDNFLDAKKKQQQEDFIDNQSLEQLAELIDDKIAGIRLKYVDNATEVAKQAGNGILQLVDRLEAEPAIGYPLFGPIINSIVRGARLRKFYLRSAATGIGKSRSMIADACNFACNEIYMNGGWQPNGTKEPTLFITTEQELEEIQTMMLAFVSEVDEEHILKGEYLKGEKERVVKAANIIADSPLYIHLLPNFNMQDIENTIKKNVREYGIKYVAHDYIHSSMAILSEISSKAGVKGLREDNILFMISTRLKDLCNEYGIFIISSTQLNGEYRDARIFDQNLLRGSKAVADKIDVGSHLLEVTKEDLEALQPLLERQGWEQPAIKMAIYKNRGNKINNVLVWCKARREVCRIEPMFVTNYNYEPITVQDIQINVIERNS